MYWTVTYSGSWCSDCNKRISTKALTGTQWINLTTDKPNIRFMYCPFCGKKHDKGKDIVLKIKL